MTVMAPATVIWVDIEKVQIGPCDSKHVEAVAVVSVDVVNLEFLGRDNLDMGPIQATRNGREPSGFVKLFS